MRIDVNCWSGFWPFQIDPVLSPAGLARQLAAEGISQAYVSATESILCPDPHLPSRRLLSRLKSEPALVPVPVLDPSLGNWKDCLDAYDGAGHGGVVKVIPNYHRYELDAPCVDDLVSVLTARPARVMMIQMRVEDERQHYPLMKVPGVAADRVIAFANRHPRLRIICLCPYLREAEQLVSKTENVWVDTAFIEFMATICRALERIPVGRLLFGSQTPFLYTRANTMKLEASGAPKRALKAIAGDNARRLLHRE